MGIIEILLIGLGLSMDAAAVSMTDGMCGQELSRGKTFLIPASFGIFRPSCRCPAIMRAASFRNFWMPMPGSWYY